VILPPLSRYFSTLSTPGLLVGTLFFAGSLTPSLLPRVALTQAILSGVALAAGYGVGVFLRWSWSYLELPMPRPRVHRIALLIASVICALIALVFLWNEVGWQNAVREQMMMEPIGRIRGLAIGLLALVIFAAVLTVARIFAWTWHLIAVRLRRHIPRRVANAIAVVLAVMLFWNLINGVLFRALMRVADTSFQELDRIGVAEADLAEERYSALPLSDLLPWESLGRTGRNWVSRGPDATELSGFFDAPVTEPIRVYVGLNSAESIDERAELALQGLIASGAFERSTLIVVTPTGTGWVDPGAMDTVEYLLRGDVASVAVQYSYLPSWMTLLVDPEYGGESAQAVFQAIYRHWTQLPRDSRPRLYLHGLSLGAMHSERSADIYDVVGDPFAGALWSGPPFRSTNWRAFTNLRNPDSPAWLPTFRDGSIVRFANQYGGLDLRGATWGPMRLVYLQYASDPVTFFETRSFYRQPEWMEPPRGPDVSPALRWYPIVTMLQLVVDFVHSDDVPAGYGHVYAAADYIDAWLAVINPENWTAPEIERLKAHFRQREEERP
jgi:uncharacterized membrane protein